MILQFEGGGPAQGLFKNVQPQGNQVRVGTPESVAEGMAAFYTIMGVEADDRTRKMFGQAVFAGMRKSAASLIDFMVDERNED